MPSSRRTVPGQETDRSRRHGPPPSYSFPFSTDIADVGSVSEQHIHGGLLPLATGAALNSSPVDIDVTTGQGKLVLVLNAGSDISGTITVTGTSVDRDTGATTASDTDDIVVDALTTDAADTDANGNARHSLTGAYITSKWFTGAVTISTADTTFTDVDVYHMSFEQVNDAPAYALATLDMNSQANNTLAELDVYLYAAVVTGSKVNVTREGSLNLTGVTADRIYRNRVGNIGKAMDGRTDGFWVDLFNKSANKIENLTMKVWVTVVGSGTDILTIAVTGGGGAGDVVGPGSSTDNAFARWDSTTGKLLQDSNSTLSDAGVATFDDGSGNTVVITPHSTDPIIAGIKRINFVDTNTFVERGAASTNFESDRLMRLTSPLGVQVHMDSASHQDVQAVNNGAGGGGFTCSKATGIVATNLINGVAAGDMTITPFSGSNLNLGGTVVISDSATIPPLNLTERSAEPSAPASGDIYLDDGTKTGSGNPSWRRYTGSAWEDIVPAVWSGKEIARVVSTQPPDNAGVNIATATNYAGGSTPIVIHRGWGFDDGTDEFMDFSGVVLADYDGSSDINVTFPILAKSDATSNTAAYSVVIGRIEWGVTDLDGDIFSGSTAVVGTKALVGAQGKAVLMEVTITNAQANGLAGGDGIVVRVFRDVSGDGVANDVMVLPQMQVVYA